MTRKGSSRKSGPDSAEKKEPVTPSSDRPTRERKVVERYLIPSVARSSSSKTLSIEKGHGTQLKDISNETMRQFSSMFNGLARSIRGENSGNGDGREAAEAMEKDAKKNDLILRSSGSVNVAGSNNLASVFSKRGRKGVNQDCAIVWKEFGCQGDMLFCGIFDGHGPWGHFVAKKVRESMPSSLLYNWQETLAQASLDSDIDLEFDKKHQRFHIWKHSYLRTCTAVDHEIELHRKIDYFYSGTTALIIVR